MAAPRTNPLPTPFPLLLCFSLQIILFLAFSLRFIYFCLSFLPWSWQNVKISISFLSYFFIFLFILSDLFLFFLQPPLRRQHFYIYTLFLQDLSFCSSFLMIICYKWQTYTTIYLVLFLHLFNFCLHLYLIFNLFSSPPPPLSNKRGVLSGGTLGRQVMLQGSLILFYLFSPSVFLPFPVSQPRYLHVCVCLWNFWHMCTRRQTHTQTSSSFTLHLAWLRASGWSAELIPLLTDPPAREGRGAHASRNKVRERRR